MKVISFLFLIFLLFTTNHAQDFSGKTIASILVIGNDKTDEDVIKREMLLDTGDTYNDSLRVLSERRLMNLFLFNDVEIIPVPDNDDLALLVKVTERLFIFPFPEFRREDRDWSKLTYGVGLAHINFRGRNEKLLGIVLFGYRPGFQIDYYNPWIGTKNRYTNRIFIRKYSTAHQVLDLSEDHFYTRWSIGRFWTRYFSSQISLDYENVQIPKKDFIDNSAGLPVPESSYTNDIWGIDFSIYYDNRDLIVYPTQGCYAAFSVINQGLFNSIVNYTQLDMGLRYFKSLGPIVLAGRTHSLITTGTLPIYRYVYLGFEERIRGHFSEIATGENRMLASLETRFHLIPLQKYNFPSFILPQSSTQNLNFGLDAAFFFDTGVVWGKDLTNPAQSKEEKKLENQKLIHGFGASLRFRLPYVEIARLEYAFNEKLDGELIFEVGISF